jgi:SagB-type dehydrogenase family enzyme
MATHQYKKFVTSPTLVIVPAPENTSNRNMFAVFDYLKKNFSYYPCETLHWISYFKEPHSLREALGDHPTCPYETLCAEIDDLFENRFLVSEKDFDGPIYGAYRQNWKWDLTTALFHFTVTDNDYCGEDEASKLISEKVATVPQPAHSWRNAETSIKLPALSANLNEPLYATMIARRTNRTSTSYPLTAMQLSKCLFAGLGITGEVETPSGWLPLGVTPSGGARNPFEAYVIVRRSDEIDAGIYHYSPMDQSLEIVRREIPDTIDQFFANQSWVDEMSAVVVLTAVLERTMWKYEDPNAYRVVIIEAGHIAQNMMLAATDLGLSACPTAALSHSSLRKLFGLSEMTHVPLYALTLDKPLPYKDTIRRTIAPTFAPEFRQASQL